MSLAGFCTSNTTIRKQIVHPTLTNSPWLAIVTGERRGNNLPSKSAETQAQRFDSLTSEKAELLYEVHETISHGLRAKQYARLSEIEAELAMLEPAVIATERAGTVRAL